MKRQQAKLKTQWRQFKNMNLPDSDLKDFFGAEISWDKISWKHLLSKISQESAFLNFLRTEKIDLDQLYELTAGHERGLGVFYTPRPLAEYLVAQTLGAYLSREKKAIEQALQARDYSAADRHISKVLALRICDPASGCGIFLRSAMASLIEFYGWLDTLQPGWADWRLHLPTQLYGVEIDPVAVQIARTLLCVEYFLHCSEQCSAEYVDTVFPNIICADTLNLAAESAWQNRFDFILGNPPYITEVRKQSRNFEKLRTKSDRYTAKMDLCDVFLSFSLDWLKPGGQLGFVLPEYWLQRDSARDLRTKIWRETSIEELWFFGEEKMFDRAAGHHSSLAIFKKTFSNAQEIDFPETNLLQPCRLGTIKHEHSSAENNRLQPHSDWLRPGELFLTPATGKIIAGSSEELSLLEKLCALPETLFQPGDIQQGIILPQGRLRKQDHLRLPVETREHVAEDAGIFLLTEDEVDGLGLSCEEQALLKPYFLPGGFEAFQGFGENLKTRHPDYFLLYIDRESQTKILESPARYARIRAHLDQFLPILTSSNKPYGLHRPRQTEWFEGESRLLALRQTGRPRFALIDVSAYVNEGFYILRQPTHTPQPPTLDAIAAILNSNLGWFWFYMLKRKGHRLQVDKDVLSLFPLPAPPEPALLEKIDQLARTIRLNSSSLNSYILTTPTEDTSVTQALNDLVNELYRLNKREVMALNDFFAHRPLTN